MVIRLRFETAPSRNPRALREESIAFREWFLSHYDIHPEKVLPSIQNSYHLNREADLPEGVTLVYNLRIGVLMKFRGALWLLRNLKRMDGTQVSLKKVKLGIRTYFDYEVDYYADELLPYEPNTGKEG